MRIALAGTPNSGKTSFYNLLTRSKEHTGMFPGTTVEVRERSCGGHTIADLPGIYSMNSNTQEEERVAREYIQNGGADSIIVVINAEQAESGFHLARDVKKFAAVPVYIVVNKSDLCNIDIYNYTGIAGIAKFSCKKSNTNDAQNFLGTLLGIKMSKDKKRILPRAVSGNAVCVFLTLLLAAISAALGRDVFWGFIQGGIIAGAGSVLKFLPPIVCLFALLAALEDTGIMARLAFLADKPLSKIGLTGKSVFPLLMGFSCSAPAITACRTLGTRRERELSAFLIPFMSCSAKIPVYSLFAGIFWEGHEISAFAVMYIGGAVIGAACLAILRAISPQNKNAEDFFIMEIPKLKFPSVRNIITRTYTAAADFLERVFGLIMVSAGIVWFLLHYGWLYSAADAAAPIFAPLGFDRRAVSALITGFLAKENIVGTFAVTGGVGFMDVSAAITFLTFVLLYTPCAAAVAAAGKRGAGMAVRHFLIAYIMSFAVRHIIGLLGI